MASRWDSRERRARSVTSDLRGVATEIVSRSTIDSARLKRHALLATSTSLTAYDAAYVAAARRNGWTLVSADIADLVSKGLAVTPDAAVYP